ncbi:MAG: choice-of-anchor tandem repeat GloVer-containing protein [Pseudomonadota bacterium]
MSQAFQINFANDVKVNYLTSLYAGGPAGWPQAGDPTAPPILGKNGRLYGLSNNTGIGVFSMPASPAHYSLTAILSDSDNNIGIGGFLGSLVQSELTEHFYGVGYRNANGSGPLETLDGGVFRVSFDGTTPERIEASIGNVVNPLGILLLDAEDTLYGTDRGPLDHGRIYKITQNGEFAIIHEFGPSPEGFQQFPNGMFLDTSGWLYGLTAYRRGLPFDIATSADPETAVGSLYRVHPEILDSFERLHTFTLAQGEIPWFEKRLKQSNGTVAFPAHGAILAHLVDGPDDYIYGTTSIGSCDTWTERPNGSFAPDESPLCGGVYKPYESDGDDRYGTAYPHYDGPNVHGTVFRIKKNGTEFSIVHQFSGADGSQPRGPMVIAPDGHLYGTTLSGGIHKNEVGKFEVGEVYPSSEDNLTYDGTLYRVRIADISLDGAGHILDSGFEHLHSFKAGIDSDSDGKVPTGLTLGHNGRLYGTTQFGGRGHTTYNGDELLSDYGGTVFEVNLEADLPEASVTITATPGSISIGDIAEITWTSNNAENCIASGGAEGDGWVGNKDIMGSIEVAPSPGVYFYTLTCDDSLRGVPVSYAITLRVDADTLINDGETIDYGNGAGNLDRHLILLLTFLTVLKTRQRHKAKVFKKSC